MTWRELNDSFNRVYDEIDALEENINRRFDEQSQKLDEQNRKIDVILRHLTGQGNSQYGSVNRFSSEDRPLS